jgi:hypothetical protein
MEDNVIVVNGRKTKNSNKFKLCNLKNSTVSSVNRTNTTNKKVLSQLRKQKPNQPELAVT